MIVPLLLAAGLFLFLRKQDRAATPVPAGTNTGPRGETVFNSEVATALLRTLGTATFTPPVPSDPTLIRLDEATSPISPTLSAAEWVAGINPTHTVAALEVLTSGDLPSVSPNSPPAFLRAIAAGNESSLPPGYAVLLYAGALAHNSAPPGTPIAVPLPDILPPITMLGTALAEVGEPMGSELDALLKVMADPSQLMQLASALGAMGKNVAASLVQERANDLASLHGTPPAPSPPIMAPGANVSGFGNYNLKLWEQYRRMRHVPIPMVLPGNPSPPPIEHVPIPMVLPNPSQPTRAMATQYEYQMSPWKPPT